MKKALFIGGTGVISAACVKLAIERGFDVTLLNRGNSPAPEGARQTVCDISDEGAARQALSRAADGRTGVSGYYFDVVIDFVAYTQEQAERDVRLFSGSAGQYIFISSASAYQKPPACDIITESTPLHNPYWLYSRNKIDCERALSRAYDETGFPITIVRPSHTYDDRKVPVAIHGKAGCWQVLRRIADGRPILIPGDGLTWWTLTYSADFAVGFVGLMGNPHAIGEAVHITSDESLTWNTIHRIIGRQLGREPVLAHATAEMLTHFDPSLEGPLVGDKSNSVKFDNTKIKRLVPEFNATTRFDQGVVRSVEYMLTHKETQIADPEFDAFCDRVIAAAYPAGLPAAAT